MERAAQQPELITEADYWRAIESLGGMIWSINHDMADNREMPGDRQALPKLQEQIERIVDDACRKFGIAHPHREGHDPGLKDYLEWYRGMKSQVLGNAYAAMVCASCPFARSKEQHISLGGDTVPCNLFNGFMRRDAAELAERCPAVVYYMEWGIQGPKSHGELVQAARERHGDEAAQRLARRLGEES